MNRTRGFTLIELLVVLAIVALLVGQLLPALAGGRARAQFTWQGERGEVGWREMGDHPGPATRTRHLAGGAASAEAGHGRAQALSRHDPRRLWVGLVYLGDRQIEAPALRLHPGAREQAAAPRRLRHDTE